MQKNSNFLNKQDLLEIFLIFVLLVSFPLIWLYNQRLNYRKFLTLNTKFSLNANSLKPSDLSSTPFVLKYLNEHEVSATLSHKVGVSSGFTVLGRTLQTEFGDVEVYEYESPSDVKRAMHKLEASGFINQLVSYKNLIIFNKNSSSEIAEVLKNIH